MASALMASTSSKSVNPSGRSVIFRGRPQALERIRLDARAVLPGDLNLQIAEAQLGLEAELRLPEALLGAGVPDEHPDAVALAARPLLAVGADLGLEEKRVHRRARREHRAALARRPILEPEAAAEELQAGDRPHADDRERDGDLEEGEPLCARAAHGRPSPSHSTDTVPTHGSRWTRMRFGRPFSSQSRRLISDTTAPVVAPFG